MTTATEPTIVRRGTLRCKATKTDHVTQEWLVREWSDGTIEQYLAGGQSPRWVVYQGQHANQIAWN